MNIFNIEIENIYTHCASQSNTLHYEWQHHVFYPHVPWFCELKNCFYMNITLCVDIVNTVVL